MSGRVYCVIPDYRPVGGVIKVLDYARHMIDLGRQPVIVSGEPLRPESPLFDIARLRTLIPSNGVAHVLTTEFGVERTDMVLFSWPRQYGTIAARLAPDVPHARIIHLIQNVRHANPAFIGGLARRLLARPMTRISTNGFVAGAIRPYAHEDSIQAVAPIGHDLEFFHTTRSGGFDQQQPLRVAYTTWKSRLGDQLAAATAGGGAYAFRRLGHEVAWPDLRDLYRWADVFLGTPLAEEGSYLPALEAMAAGALVIMPDAVGNRTYARFGETCVEAQLDDPDSYLDALEQIRRWPPGEIEAMRSAAQAAAAGHSLDEERTAVREVLDQIEREAVPRHRHPAAAASLAAQVRDGWE